MRAARRPCSTFALGQFRLESRADTPQIYKEADADGEPGRVVAPPGAAVTHDDVTLEPGDLVLWQPWLAHSTENRDDRSVSINGEARPVAAQLPLPKFCAQLHTEL